MIDDILTDLKASITKAHEALKRDLAKVRTGRATTAMLDSVKVDYYGTPTPLSQMSSINVPEPRLLIVKPWDKSVMKLVEKSILQAELGFNPQIDGDFIRIPIPPLTEERRKEMVKLAKKYGEECKVAIRNVRRDALELLSAVESDGEASADEVDRGKKKAEELVTDGQKAVETFVSHKEKYILEI